MTKRIYQRPVKTVYNNWLLAGLLQRLHEPAPKLPATERGIPAFFKRVLRWVRRS